MVVPEGAPPKRVTSPPLRTIWRACSQVSGSPTASITLSAPPPLRRPVAHDLDGVHPLGRLDRLLGAQFSGDGEPVATPVDADHPRAPFRGQTDKHQADLARPDDRYGIAHGDGGTHYTVHGTCERLQKRRPAVLHAPWDLVKVLPHDPFRHHDVLGEGAVEEGEVLAHGLVTNLAIVAMVARCGVGRDDPRAGPPAFHALTDRLDGPPELVAERGWDLRDQGRMPALVSLHVHAAGQGRPYAHQDFTGPRHRHRHVFHPDVARLVEHRCPQRKPPPPSKVQTKMARDKFSKRCAACADAGG